MLALLPWISGAWLALVGAEGCGPADSPPDEDGVATASRASAITAPPFDMKAIADASTADCRFENEHTLIKNGVVLRAWNVSYVSWEWRAAEGGRPAGLQPIRIRAFAARPLAGTGRQPAVVQAHGLGGYADENAATSSAARLGMFVLAYTGPGGGTRADNTSEGKPASDRAGYRMFDTREDVRGSWFWAHTTAGLRGLTCLAARTDVDGGRLGMTGFSAGGVATFLGAGADTRIRAAVPVSGVLAWDEATQSPTAWQHTLLSQAGLSTASPEWTALMRGLIGPAMALSGVRASLLALNGTTDEFFPLTAHMATLRGLPSGADVRSSLVGNFDHGCYKVSGGEAASTIEARAALHADGGQRAFFRHHLAADAAYPAIPRAPVVAVATVAGATQVVARVDRPAGLDVEDVRLYVSTDNNYLFANTALSGSGGTYSVLVPGSLSAASSYFVDVQYRNRALLNPGRFTVSSEPVLAPGLVPRIRAINTCL